MSAITQVSYFSLPICHSDPVVFVWGAQVRMWENLCSHCATAILVLPTAHINVWFCKDNSNKYHLWFCLWFFFKNIKMNSKEKTPPIDHLRRCCIFLIPKKEKKKKITEFFCCSCSQASKQSSKFAAYAILLFLAQNVPKKCANRCNGCNKDI